MGDFHKLLAARPRVEIRERLGTPSRVSLRTGLLIWFLGISLIPLVIINGVGYQKALTSRQEDVEDRLVSVSEERLLDLQEFFAEQFLALDQQAGAVRNLEFLQALTSDLEASGQEYQGWVRSNRWQDLNNLHGRDLRNLLDNPGLQDVLLVDPNGWVLYSCQECSELGLDLNSRRLGATPLAQAFKKVLQENRPVFSGFTIQEESERRSVGYLAQQIRNQEGEDPRGVLLFRLTGESLTEIVRRANLLGVSDRTYVVNRDLELLTEIQQDSWAREAGNRIVTEPTLDWARQQVQAHDFPIVRMPIQGEFRQLVTEYRGPGNEPVFGIWRDLEVQGMHLGVITEVNKDASFAGLKSMLLGMTLLLVVVSLLVALAGLMVSHRIVAPITSLTRAMQRVADGHTVSEMPVSGPHEVGRLAQQFGIMLKTLNEAKTVNDRQYRLQKRQFELNEKMRGEPDLATLAASVLEYIGEFYSAQVGAFYLTRPGGRLVLAARFGLAEESEIATELRLGEGLVGKAAEQGRSQILHHLPPGHLPVKTGMGESSPTALIIAPFLLEGQVKGLLELGTFGEFADEDLEFLRLSGESVAMALDSARSRERVHRLLEETRRQAGILSRQQKELQLTNAQLARSDQYKNEFLANMSHELRTPLNSMLIMSQILAENQQGNLDGDQVVAAETIHMAGSDLLTIINDILDLSRVEAGKLDISCEMVDLSAFLKNQEALFRPMANEMGLEFRVEADLDLPEVFHSDQGRVSQILNNLLGNALKFTDKGSVVLRIQRPEPEELAGLAGNGPDSWLAFSVVDTGIGMTGEKSDQMFQAFNQGDGSIGRRFGGSGLGLSISRKLADLLGGQIRVKSKENEGSTFTFYLPLEFSSAGPAAGPVAGAEEKKRGRAQAAAGGPGRPGETVHSLTGVFSPEGDSAAESWRSSQLLQDRQVLLCAQDMRTVYRLTAGLEDLGARVLLARTWEEALTGARNNPDLALVEPDLFGLDPTEAGIQLKENSNGRSFPVITMAARGKVNRSPVWPHTLVKPVDMEQLVKVLAEIPLDETVSTVA